MAPSEVPEPRSVHVEARANALNKRNEAELGKCALRARVRVHRNARLQLS